MLERPNGPTAIGLSPDRQSVSDWNPMLHISSGSDPDPVRIYHCVESRSGILFSRLYGKLINDSEVFL